MESRLRQRTEGRLDRSRDPVILDAALAVVSENGYDAASMNDIAARAGVGKAAIYRRWSSKAALITDALIYWRPDLLVREVPDTGSLAGDLDALIEQIGRADQDPVPNDLVLRVALEAAHEPGLAAAVDDLVLVKGKGLVAKILAQAAARGEIDAQRDWSMIADVVLAMGLLQVVRGQTLDAAFVRNVIDALVLPALRGPATA
ncbi:TetR/AcrR family transcriptional regulator [Mycolicibacter arupensis]|jgi:AcrR family transcriptional regulator|uniref:TetR family transcriptional regulator n=1 Tax=Mycolicibacter arupensis TaxID=342002 RepID=A0A0F5MYW7_9MYCO|nr:TetR/AcrR family transcriptional regulator [Mycolicibacter arupensis]KKC00014.1 TetR family transcriptional regulator [Mycolicibacter arupensis]MCV7274660.1 TetR/AcrR family transcriptional regulator [Mycolicibacter arupensis]OQZ97509.1 TetR family transcriptional regulator [Mycolicibacter arupensis]